MSSTQLFQATNPYRVAVVDDEPSIRETITMALEQAGYSAECYSDGQAAWEVFSLKRPDCAILDVLMPRMDGLELCRKIRAIDENLPILFLSSRADEIDRILGLEMGADDYLTKPFSLRELMVRLKVLRRRTEKAQASPAQDHPLPAKPQPANRGLVLDADCFVAFWNGTELHFSVTEFRLLQCLAAIPGHVKTREQLMQACYPEPTWVDERTMDTHIKRIRHKCSAIDPHFEAIEAVHGLGYRLKAPA